MWVQTCATVVCNSKNADEQNIICVNYVISNRECANLILDCCQMENGLEKVKREEIVKDPNNGAGSPGNGMGSNGDASPPDSGPSTGPPGSNAHRHSDTQKSPKSGTPEPRSRTGRHNQMATPISTMTSTAEKSSISEATSAPPVTSGSSRRGQKRKTRTEEPSDDSVAQQQHNHVESTESSVKDLENAMSKHLPSPAHSATPSGSTTDFSTDALLKQQQHQQQQHHHLHQDQQHPDKNSTIQWIGHHNHHFHQQPAPMPATALLRQLYANRESVIRATTRPAPGGVFYSTDASQNGPLPTPPGSESSFDNQFLLHSAHNQAGAKGVDAFNNLVTNYSGYPMDYHNAMTPPSSVSPRDSNAVNGAKQSAAIHGAHQTSSFDYTDSLRSQYATLAGDQTTPSLPLKPQPYSAAAMHHVDAYGGLDQSQYFPHHSGFHLYHKGSPSAAGWYSTPS